jgi:oligoendopeptidase F
MVEVGITIETIVAIVTSLSSGLLAWNKFKSKLHDVRQFIDTLDDALYDDKVTEQEYRAIWELFQKIVNNKER